MYDYDLLILQYVSPKPNMSKQANKRAESNKKNWEKRDWGWGCSFSSWITLFADKSEEKENYSLFTILVLGLMVLSSNH